MKTLGKQSTAAILGSEEAWNKLRKKWSEIMNSPRREELTAAQHLLVNAALGRDFTKGFTSISKNTRKGANKLESLISPDQALCDALGDLHNAVYDPNRFLDVFEGAITTEAFDRLKAVLARPFYHLSHFSEEPYIGAPVIEET